MPALRVQFASTPTHRPGTLLFRMEDAATEVVVRVFLPPADDPEVMAFGLEYGVDTVEEAWAGRAVEGQTNVRVIRKAAA